VRSQSYKTANFIRNASELASRHDGQLYALTVKNDLLKLGAGETEPRTMRPATIGADIYDLNMDKDGGLYAFSGTHSAIVRLDVAGRFDAVGNHGARSFCDFFVEGSSAVILADNSIFIETDGHGRWLKTLPVNLPSRVKLVAGWFAVVLLALVFWYPVDRNAA